MIIKPPSSWVYRSTKWSTGQTHFYSSSNDAKVRYACDMHKYQIRVGYTN